MRSWRFNGRDLELILATVRTIQLFGLLAHLAVPVALLRLMWFIPQMCWIRLNKLMMPLGRLLTLALVATASSTSIGLAATVKWVGQSGDWSNASHWSSGALPGPDDSVGIDTSNGGMTVTVSSGNNQVGSLSCQEAQKVTGGALAAGSIQVSQNVALQDGTIQAATIQISSGAALVVSSGTLDLFRGI